MYINDFITSLMSNVIYDSNIFEDDTVSLTIYNLTKLAVKPRSAGFS